MKDKKSNKLQNPIDECISWFDIDGRGIRFQFLDSDISVIKDSINKHLEIEIRKILWDFVHKYEFSEATKEQIYDILIEKIKNIQL
ncbi:MAG TPA: hypothetical protein VGB37_14825 [Candidatus Lokiarchaeia archaeon]